MAALFAAALAARLLSYRTILPTNINDDEVAWAWQGQSLLLQHSPASWSWLRAYHVVAHQRSPLSGHLFPYVQHWLDHPPLFGLLVGGTAVLGGETTLSSVSAATIRLVPVLLSSVSVILLVALLRRIGVAWWLALGSGALLAFAPGAVELSALTESEWLLAPMLLGALLLCLYETRWSQAGVLLLCAAAPMVKVPGIAVGFACALTLLVVGRRWPLALGCAAAAAAGLLAYAAYGAAVDWQQFLAVWHAQSARHANPFAVAFAFVIDRRMGPGRFVPTADPLWYVGLGCALLAAALIAWSRRRLLLVPLIGVASYVVVMGLVGPGAPAIEYNGWYRIAIYPLIYAAPAVAVAAVLTLRDAALVNKRLRAESGNLGVL